jgi:hypothetical protein
MTARTWTTPRPATAQEKTTSLKHGLLWSLAVIHGCFVAALVAIYAVAAAEMNGDAFNDLGVALGRQMAINDLLGVWLLTGLGTALGAAALYFGLKSKWRP